MDKNIGVGIIVGLTLFSTIFILKSNYFSKTQKIILGILLVFPPAQWLLAIILGVWNKKTESTIGFKIDNAEKNNIELEKLRNLGVLSEQEYNDKKEKVLLIKSNELFLNSEEYNSLQKLKQNNILTQEEFEQKAELLRSKIQNEIDLSETNKNVYKPDLSSEEPKSAKIITIVLLTLFFGMIFFGIIKSLT